MPAKLILIPIVLFTLLSRGDDMEKNKQYSLLIEEWKNSALASWLHDITPENVERKFLYRTTQSDRETEEKFYYFQKLLLFIHFSELYPSLENLLKIALEGGQDDVNAQIAALRILSSPHTKLEKSAPSVQMVSEFLAECENVRIVIEAVPLLTRIDQEKGYAFADTLIRDKNITLKDKMILSLHLMHFAYTGGYVTLPNLIESDDAIIKSNLPILLDYYSRYNGKFVTNTEIIIDTDSMQVF